jgi:hypothetical protein
MYAAWAGVIISLILAAITLIYVLLTNKIMHSPYLTRLKVMSFPDNKKIMIKNIGHSIAKGVNIIGYFGDETTINAIGQYEIEPGQKLIYNFEAPVNPDMPIKLTWLTLTGKKESITWKREGSDFLPAGLSESNKKKLDNNAKKAGNAMIRNSAKY